MNDTFGFSVPAFAALLVLFLPNLLNTMIIPKRNLLAKNVSRIKWVNILRRVSQILSVALLLFAVDAEFGNRISINSGLILALFFLVVYYAAWVQYLRNKATPFGLIFGISLMAPLYLIAVGRCLHNDAMVIPCIVYGILSVGIAAIRFWPRAR